jgi:hypothetical protein
MKKRDQTAKQVKRLQLRREVIRVLAGDSLAQVRGGWPTGCVGPSDDGSLCNPSH